MKFKILYFLLFFIPLFLCAQEKKNTSVLPLYGTVFIESDIPDADVYIGEEFKGKTPLKLNNLEFNLQYTFIIKKDNYRTVKKYITVYKYKPEIKIFVEIGYSSILFRGNPEDATLILNNKVYDRIPIDTLKIIPGDKNIQIKKKGYYKLQNRYELKTGSFEMLEFNLQPKSKIKALIFSGILPGSGQYYTDQDFKGYNLLGMEMISLSLFYYYNRELKSLISNYNNLNASYEQTTNPADAEVLHNKIKNIYDDIDNNETLRDIFLSIAICNWVYNMVDIYLWDEPVYEQTYSIMMGNILYNNGSFSPVFKFTYRF